MNSFQNIYLIDETNNLTELSSSLFESEDILQKLLADHPSILAGAASESTPRWLLVEREAGVPDDSDSSNRWSVDHLFLDQFGIPTLVEVKRSTDTRIRREVVGQMLDYAANAIAFWPVERIISAFEDTCQVKGADSSEVLSQHLGDDRSEEEFWQLVKTNLAGGRLRLVFVSDDIPKELRRIIEFLNEQMASAEVIGIEVKQFVGEGIKTLVPTILGQTSRSQDVKRASIGKPLDWNHELFNEKLAEHASKAQREFASSLLASLETLFPDSYWGRGTKFGTRHLAIRIGDTVFNPISIWTSGGIQFQFKKLRKALGENEPLVDEWMATLPESYRVAMGEYDKEPTFSEDGSRVSVAKLVAGVDELLRDIIGILSDS